MTCWRGYRKNPQRNEVGMAEEKTFLIKIITPERVFYEGTAIMAEFNTSEGEISILAEAAEWPGEIDIKRAEAAQKRAEERLQAHSPDTDMARAETALLRAVARIEALR